ncbi:MAG TPA: hypothetical protein VHD56_12305 [Tepidisphaeraceae bacterium]|nr:hypothetical protein [Tepidisphaeraceae bacterium]
MSIEICASCGRKIGSKEPAMLWKENVVCAPCLQELRAAHVDRLCLADLIGVSFDQTSTLDNAFVEGAVLRPKSRLALAWIFGIAIGIFVAVLVALRFAGMLTGPYGRIFQSPDPVTPVMASKPGDRLSLPIRSQDSPQAKSEIEEFASRANGFVLWNSQRILLDARFWESLKFDAKSELLQKFERYCESIAQRPVAVRILDSRSSQTLAESLPGQDPKIFP